MFSLTLDGAGQFFRGRVSTATGSALVFISPIILSHIQITKEVLGDGTFFPVPDLFYQMFTLHLKAYGHVSYHRLLDDCLD